jgi:hypothetical protein
MSKPQEIFSLIKQHATGSFKDSLVNIMYLKNNGFSVGEFAEIIIVENINRMKLNELSAKFIGNKTKNRYDSKTDIIVRLGAAFIPFSVKTGLQVRIKVKSGISNRTKKIFRKPGIIDKHELISAIKIELSSNLYILHINKRENNFVFDLKKIDLGEFSRVKKTRKSISLRNKNGETIVSYDVPRSLWYVNKRALIVIDSFVLGRDNSEDKALKGESLLINNILKNVCFCDIPALRKIDKIVKEEI